MDVICERTILGLVLAILVWSPMALGSAPPLEFAVVQGLTALALGVWGIRSWTQRPFRLFWPPLCWAVLVFLFYALLRCQWVPVPYVGHRQMMQVMVYAALFFVILHNLNRRESAVIAGVTVIAVGFVVAFLALLQFATHTPSIWGVPRPDVYLGRGSGTFINPNNMAGYLAMIAPLALAFTVMGRFSATSKALMAYAALAMMAGIAVSLSRGGMMAAALSLALLCLILIIQRDFWLPAAITLVCIAGAAIVLTTQISSLQKRFTMAFQHDRVEDGRLYYWQAAWWLYDTDRLWGVGPGHYDVEFPSVRPSDVQVRPQFVHNDYLNTLCEWGIVGMTIISAAGICLYLGAYKAWRAVRRAGNEIGSGRSDKGAFVIGATLGLVAVMLHCIVDFNLHIPGDAVTAVALMALLTAQLRFATEGYWKNPRWLGKLALMGLTGAAAVYLLVQAVHSGREAWWLHEAERDNLPWNQAVACLKKAWEIEPGNFQTAYTLGEYYRDLSLEGNPGWQDQAREAFQWYRRAMDINPFDGYSPMSCGKCLDWLGEPKMADPYFDLAERNDPHNIYIAIQEGRHCLEKDDAVTAMKWFVQSYRLYGNREAEEQEELLHRRMADPFPPGVKPTPK